MRLPWPIRLKKSAELHGTKYYVASLGAQTGRLFFLSARMNGRQPSAAGDCMPDLSADRSKSCEARIPSYQLISTYSAAPRIPSTWSCEPSSS